MDQRAQLESALGNAYTLERELGGGGMSRVFLAEERALGRKVVVKVLPPDLSAGVNVERFRREIQLAAQLQQAQIVPVLSAGEVDGVPYYTMPFVEGESLRARLARDGMLPIFDVIGVLRDVTRALAYAHTRGVVHRDIKPDNVLLSGGTAVVTDFGIAKAISAARSSDTDTALTQLGTSVGTPAYTSPEQAAGDPNVDHRADLYSLGCMAYELLTGKPPFAGRTPQRTFAAHLTETPAPIESQRSDVPPSLAGLVMRCLEKDPAARPQSAGEIGAALDSATSGVGAAAPDLARTGSTGRTLAIYAASFVIIALVAKAAVIALDVPDWVFGGSVILMTALMPVVVAAAYKAIPLLTLRRAFHVSATAVGAFTAVVVAIMVLRVFGVGPAASLLAAGTLSGRERLLVADFAAGADTSLSHLVTEAVRTNLSQSKVVSIMPPAAVGGALARMQRPPITPIDLPLARDIAVREGVKAIVVGSLTPLGAGYAVSIRLVAADSGNELAAYRTTVDAPSELLDAIDQLTRKLRGRIGESLQTVRAAPALDQVTTSSLEALRKYAEATRAFDLSADYAKAATLLREAVAHDTTFAMAYRKLGVSLSNNGMPRPMIDSALTKAYQYSSRLPDKERSLTVATYFETGPGRDRRQSRTALERVLAIDSTDPTALNNLANNQRQMRQLARAESLYRVLATSSRAAQVSVTNYAGVLFLNGKLAASESVYRVLGEKYPAAQAGQMYRALFMYQRGQMDSAETMWRSRLNDTSTVARVSARGNLATFARLRGRLREADSLARAARQLNESRGARSNPLTDSIDRAASVIWYLGQNAEGVRILDAALARTPLRTLRLEQRPYFLIAGYYAWAGRPDRARAVLAEYDADVRDSSMRNSLAPGLHNALGEIALAEKRPLDAVKEFWKSDSLPDGPAGDCGFCTNVNVARAYDLANEPDSAIAHFEQYLSGVSPSRQVMDASYLAGVRRRLGELYEAKGNHQRAASNYLAFIELWKNADPALQPKVQEARRRVARLRDIAGK